jgi:sterol desaturase/sphingolipid hydroxylase (fatty acid hydroxylase superfamily)
MMPLGLFIPFFIVKIKVYEFLLALLFVYIRTLLAHDNRLTWLVGNHHLLHHKYRRYNFGEYWIDSLFNTCYPNKEEYIYGLIYT